MPIQSVNPVGTVEQVQRAGGDLNEWGTCSKPAKDGTSIGCRAWELPGPNNTKRACPWRDRPHNWGVRKIIQDGMGGVVANEMEMYCWDYLIQKPQTVANGGMMKIVAKEGETINCKGTQRTVREDGTVVWMPFVEKRVVSPFPDITMHKGMQDRQYLNDLRQADEEREAKSLEAQFMGDPIETEHERATEADKEADSGSGPRRGPGRPRKTSSPDVG